MIAEQELLLNLADPMWRMDNLYTIFDVIGNKIPFRMTGIQSEILAGRHSRTLILKDRKHGVSTVISLYILDTALFSPNTNAVILTAGGKTAERMLKDVLLFAYDNLPIVIKEALPIEVDTGKAEIRFENGSKVAIRQNVRGVSPTILYCHELRRLEDENIRAEILNNSIPAVPDGGIVIVDEPLYDGEDMYEAAREVVDKAERIIASGRPFNKTDFKVIRIESLS